MPDSILVNARNSLSGRTARTTRSIVTALVKSLPHTAPGTKDVYLAPSPSVRKLSVGEEALVKKIYEHLSPTVLHPLEGNQRPWPRRQTGSTDTGGMRPDDLQLQLHLERSLTSFVPRIPALASFEKVDSTWRRDGDLLTAVNLRMDGHKYEAACLLKRLVGDEGRSSDMVRLHFNDTLIALGLHSTAHHCPIQQSPILWDAAPVSAALFLFTYASQLFDRLTLSPTWERAEWSEISKRMFQVPTSYTSWHELYAAICYCHTVVTILRFTCAIEATAKESLCKSGPEAVECLLQLWRMLDGDLQIEQKSFLRWRCGQAANECLPFSIAALHLPEKEDVFSALITTNGEVSSPAFAVLRRCWNGGVVGTDDFRSVVSEVDRLIGLNDLRSVEEILQAIQLIPHHDLTPLRQSLRPHLWQIHQEMLPTGPWVLDNGLHLPIYLWVAEGAKSKTLAIPQVRSASALGVSATERTGLSRLQFSFDALDPDKQAATRWVYAWSILYRCIQYAPSGLHDQIYPLLFLDSDLFSWSQLCQRLRHICRTRLSGESDCDLILDGIDDPHGDIAGTGSLLPFAQGPERISQLTGKIAGLDELQGQLQYIVRCSPQEVPPVRRGGGIDNLIGLCMVWKGFARLARALERSEPETKPPETLTMSVVSSPTRAPTQGAGEELVEVQKDFQRAYDWATELDLSWLVLPAVDGLLNVHDSLFHSQLRGQGRSQEIEKAKARLALCQAFQDVIRLPLLQALAPSPHSFEFGSRVAVFATPEHKLVQLFEAAQQSLYILGSYKEATVWLQLEVEHVSLGHAMAVTPPALAPRHVFSSDPPVSMLGIKEICKQVLSHFHQRWLQRIAKLVPAVEPTTGSQMPISDIASLLGALPPGSGPAKVIQFGTHSEREVVVYATDNAGQVVQQLCPLWTSSLEVRRTRFLALTDLTPSAITLLRGLDVLAQAISTLTRPDELLIIVPGSVCRGIPLHLLLVQGRKTLSERNPITYAPSPVLMRRCVETSLDTQRVVTRQRGTTSVADFPCNDPYWTDKVQETGRYVANKLKGTPLIANEATLSAVSNALTHHEWFFFFGHGWGGRNPDGTLGLPAMLLQGDEQLDQYTMRSLHLPDTTAFLIGCEFSKVRIKRGSELSSLALTTLQSGAVSVVGTLYEIFAPTCEVVAEVFINGIRPPDGQTNDGIVVDLARNLQRATAAVREQSWGITPTFWGPFVLYGSPYVRLGYGWIPEPAVSPNA